MLFLFFKHSKINDRSILITLTYICHNRYWFSKHWQKLHGQIHKLHGNITQHNVQNNIEADRYCSTLALHHRLQEYSHLLSLLRCLSLHLPWLEQLSSTDQHSLFSSQASWNKPFCVWFVVSSGHPYHTEAKYLRLPPTRPTQTWKLFTKKYCSHKKPSQTIKIWLGLVLPYCWLLMIKLRQESLNENLVTLRTSLLNDNTDSYS